MAIVEGLCAVGAMEAQNSLALVLRLQRQTPRAS